VGFKSEDKLFIALTINQVRGVGAQLITDRPCSITVVIIVATSEKSGNNCFCAPSDERANQLFVIFITVARVRTREFESPPTAI
jgi:hypothetical protein